MKISKGKLTTIDVAFKANKSTEDKECSCSDPDEEEVKFFRILKKCACKYKGEIPFKCFNCGRVGNYASKCPYKDNET